MNGERQNRALCPRCGKEYTGHPAVSRHSLGDICPACGYREALEAVGMKKEVIEEMVSQMGRLEAAIQAEIDAGRDPRELDLGKVMAEK